MKWPSRRKSLPNGTVSWTSTAWKGERNFSNSRADRTKNAQSSVRYSVIRPGPTSPGCLASGIPTPAANRLEALARGLERGLERREEALGLAGVVGGVVAHVDVDRDEAGLRPRMNRQMRLGKEHRAGDALRRELEEAVAHHGEPRA